jgi:hypothetical protein
VTKATKAEIQTALREYMKQLAAKGAKKGGQRRMAQLSPEERSALGRRAVRKRWADEAKRKKNRSS